MTPFSAENGIDVYKRHALSFAVEAGSAGMAEVEKLGASFTEVKDQATALMEVAAGTSDAAVIDSLMAGAMVGEGTSYDSLTYTVSPVSYTHLDVYKRQP